jgi:hypothetical protein
MYFAMHVLAALDPLLWYLNGYCTFEAVEIVFVRVLADNRSVMTDQTTFHHHVQPNGRRVTLSLVGCGILLMVRCDAMWCCACSLCGDIGQVF